MVRKNSLIVLFIVSALLAACAPQATQPPAPLETQPVETQLPESLLPTEVIPATEMQPVSILWTGYRDDRYGIGLAFPCWWAFTPMPTEGYGGAISLRSFDEEYFRAHSTKGNWNNSTPPEGVFALDIAVFEGIDPALSTVDAWMTFTDPEMSAIVSTEERIIGQNTALVILMQNLNNSSDPPATLYLYRLAPDKLLMVNPLFQDRLDADDIQGVLTSLSLSPDVPIQVPTVAPHEPLTPAACANN
jgi:hypothetical protein